MGEAGFDRRGLWIDDKEQGWSLRVGEVSSNIYLSAAEGYMDSGDREGLARWNEDMSSVGPVFGLFFSKRF